MSENDKKKTKVFKKIKIKKPAPAPVSVAPENAASDLNVDDLINIDDILNSLDEKAPAAAEEKTPVSAAAAEEDASEKRRQAEEEDDEFEQLLNQFINSETINEDLSLTDEPAEETPAAAEKAALAASGDAASLDSGEKALFEAYQNFVGAISLMAAGAGLDAPVFNLEPQDLFPHYKPKIGKRIARDTLKGWDIMLAAHATRISSIDPNASDEELLNFAEKTTDDILQLAVISYVEILIEIEGCDISYEERKLKAQRRKIEREIYEEHERRLERKKRYIELINKKKFPIDADRLISNYFKTAQKDPEGAYEVLINNPAVYAPIDISKIKPRLFGLIKVTPQDGIRVNREIGDFLKKVKA